MEPSKSESIGGTWTFGRFRLIPTRQLLLQDGVPVQIGSRALDILTVLVRRSGELISKHELIAAVWPDTFVDESNLKVNICSLRRSLGDTQKHHAYIATVAGRGYRFVAPVQSAIAVPAVLAVAAVPPVPTPQAAFTSLNWALGASQRIVPHRSRNSSTPEGHTYESGPLA